VSKNIQTTVLTTDIQGPIIYMYPHTPEMAPWHSWEWILITNRGIL